MLRQPVSCNRQEISCLFPNYFVSNLRFFRQVEVSAAPRLPPFLVIRVFMFIRRLPVRRSHNTLCGAETS